MRKKRIPLNLPAVVGDYLESLRVRHYAPDTIYSREGELRHFWIYLQSIGVSEFREVSQRLLEDYHRESLERLADSTASLNLDILRSFFEYLENLGVILLNPCLWLPKPRLKKRLPRQIPQAVRSARLVERPGANAQRHPGQGHAGSVLLQRHSPGGNGAPDIDRRGHPERFCAREQGQGRQRPRRAHRPERVRGGGPVSQRSPQRVAGRPARPQDGRALAGQPAPAPGALR